jgi:GNAT superfamily N-acetyltransferase
MCIQCDFGYLRLVRSDQFRRHYGECVPTIDRLPIQSVTMRPAEPYEASVVRDIDDRVFPERSDDLQRARAGELEEGVESKDVYLFEMADQAVAYLHVDRRDPQRIYLSGFGILPEIQNRGLGTVLVALAQPILEEYEHKVPIYTVTSPRNTRMLRLLFNLRFVGRWVLPDHFGPGRHRIGCQILRRSSGLLESAETQLLRFDDVYELARLADDGWVIRDQRKGETGPHFELAVGSGDDFLTCPSPAVHTRADHRRRS